MSFISAPAAAPPPPAAHLSRPLGRCRPLPPCLLEGGKLPFTAWACWAETPASLSPGGLGQQRTRACAAVRGRALLRPSAGLQSPHLSGPPSLRGGGNLTLHVQYLMCFLDIIHKGMFILLTKKQALSFFSSWQGGPLGLFSLLFHEKRGQRRPTHFRFDLGNDSGMQSSGQGSGDSGEGALWGAVRNPHREAAPPFLCVQRAKQVRSASL